MRKVVRAIAVYGPIALCGSTVLFLSIGAFGWMFVPYNGYIWCVVLTAVCLSVCLCAKSDYNGKIPRIEENGILIFATLNTVMWIYVWSATEYTVILPFGAVCIVFAIYNAVKLCDDTVKRTLSMMIGAMMAMVGIIILTVPILTPMPIIKERFNTYNGQGIVAKVTIIREAGNVYEIKAIVKKTSRDLMLGRFEEAEKIPVVYRIIDTEDYQKPRFVWEGMDLYMNGEKIEIYWK